MHRGGAVAQLHFRCFPGYRYRCRIELKAKLILSHRRPPMTANKLLDEAFSSAIRIKPVSDLITDCSRDSRRKREREDVNFARWRNDSLAGRFVDLARNPPLDGERWELVYISL